MFRRLSLAAFFAAVVPTMSFALPADAILLAQAGTSRLVLDDGTTVDGEITDMNADVVTVRTAQGSREIPRARVVRIEFAPAGAETPAPPPMATPAPGATPPPEQAAPPAGEAREGWRPRGESVATPAPAPTPGESATGPASGGFGTGGSGSRDYDRGRMLRPMPGFVINGFLGGKSLNTDWEPVGGQFTAGLETTFLPMSDIPLGFAFDVLASGGSDYGDVGPDRDVIYSASSQEMNVGVRFLQEIDPHIPISLSLGGGLAAVHASIGAKHAFTDDVLYDESDSGIGVWASGGMHLRLLDYFNIGATIRYSSSTVELLGHETDPGGVTFAAVAGFSFGFPSQYRHGTRQVHVRSSRRYVAPARRAPGSVSEMWLNTPGGGSQHVVVGQWIFVERTDGAPVEGRVNRLFPDAIELAASGGGLYTIPTNRIVRIR